MRAKFHAVFLGDRAEVFEEILEPAPMLFGRCRRQNVHGAPALYLGVKPKPARRERRMIDFVLVELLNRRRASSVAVVDFGIVALHAAAAEVVAEALYADFSRIRDGRDEVSHLLVLPRLVQNNMVDVLGVEVLDSFQHETMFLRLKEYALEVLGVPYPVTCAERHPCDHCLTAELTRHREMTIAPSFRMHCQT